jgi:hypothetical protein
MRSGPSKFSPDPREALRRQGRFTAALRREPVKAGSQAMVVRTESNGQIVTISCDVFSEAAVSLAYGSPTSEHPAGGSGRLRDTIPQRTTVPAA